MHICILNSVHPADDTRVLRIASALSEDGHRVTVVSKSGDVPKGCSTGSNSLEFIEIGSKAIGTFHPQRSPGALFRTFVSRLIVNLELFIRGWRLKADVYHCNEVDSWFVGIILKVILRKKVVFDVHEYYPSKMLNLLPVRWLHKPVENIFVWLFAAFSSVTDGAIFVNRSLAGFYGFRCRQVVVRPCVERSRLEKAESNSTLSSRYEGRTVLLHVGSMREEYGASSMLESIALCRDVFNLTLVILGGARNPGLFRRKIVDLSLSERVEVIDQVPFSQVLQYLKIADVGLILVQPCEKSFVYSLPRKFLEYVAFGLPVVAPHFPEMKHLAEQYDFALLVDPENPEDIAEAIRRLARDSTLRQRLGRNSQRAFEEELNWEMESRRLLDLYDTLEV